MSAPRLRAPTADGAVLAEPPLAEVGRLLAENRSRLARGSVGFLGQSLPECRDLARREALAAARSYLTSAGEPVPHFADGPLLVAGHQPELFHPGVWVKNFALNGLARQHRAIALNFVVDTDTAKSAALRLPAPPSANVPWPHVHTETFDRWSGERPYEELTVADSDRFNHFAARAGAVLAGWDYRPMLPEFWAEVLRQGGRTPLIGEQFVAARRVFERNWGCHNLEVPVSQLNAGEAFARFACRLLADLPRFHVLYNETVRDYRRRNGLRGHHHPVPDLAEESGWLEVPFWGWRAGQDRRGRLLVRVEGDQIRLRVGADTWPSLPTGERGVAVWRQLAGQGYKLRSRALTTTLFARLLLADLFVHGIGGGKYDELTDELIRRVFGMEPPAFVVLSATLLLPLPMHRVGPDNTRQLARSWRDLYYNPQRHPQAGRLPPDLVREKEAWIAAAPSEPRPKHERFQAIRALTQRLRPAVADRLKALRTEWERCEHQVRANAVLGRRDYAFCLYPESQLRAFCGQFLKGTL